VTGLKSSGSILPQLDPWNKNCSPVLQLLQLFQAVVPSHCQLPIRNTQNNHHNTLRTKRACLDAQEKCFKHPKKYVGSLIERHLNWHPHLRIGDNLHLQGISLNQPLDCLQAYPPGRHYYVDKKSWTSRDKQNK